MLFHIYFTLPILSFLYFNWVLRSSFTPWGVKICSSSRIFNSFCQSFSEFVIFSWSLDVCHCNINVAIKLKNDAARAKAFPAIAILQPSFLSIVTLQNKLQIISLLQVCLKSWRAQGVFHNI